MAATESLARGRVSLCIILSRSRSPLGEISVLLRRWGWVRPGFERVGLIGPAVGSPGWGPGFGEVALLVRSSFRMCTRGFILGWGLALVVLLGVAGAKAAGGEAPEVIAADEGYVGITVCQACHSAETQHWKGTRHAELFLKSPRTPLEERACEACHGPLEGHPNDPRVESIPITESQCVGCHDPANSPQFDFEIYNWKATCQSHEGMTPPAGLSIGGNE